LAESGDLHMVALGRRRRAGRARDFEAAASVTRKITKGSEASILGSRDLSTSVVELGTFDR
jgi:hypothetical protein